ncbi:MAG: hypothetical protein ABI316_10570, partial [Casimicrobiaceae bacterium]
IIAVITEAAAVREILIHLGEPITPPTTVPSAARRGGRCAADGSVTIRALGHPRRPHCGRPAAQTSDYVAMVGDSPGPCTILRHEIPD